jgi:hypothetical protein
MTDEVRDKADDKAGKAEKKPEPRRPGVKTKRGASKRLPRKGNEESRKEERGAD